MAKSDPKYNLRFVAFFIAVVLLSTIYPLFTGSAIGIIALHGLISMVLTTGIYVVSCNRRWVIFGAVLGIVALIATWLNLAASQIPLFGMIWIISQLMFYAFVVFCILRQIIRSHQVTSATILGAISVYFLIAIFWAMLFYLLEILQPGSFVVAGDRQTPIDPNILIYFAQITITSVGYGEVLPTTAIARSLAAILAMTGQLYLTVLIAILIGIYLSNKTITPPSK
jgi:hypothetical protein